MLQELLLALSGHSSPLLDVGNGKLPKADADDLLSPAETALLTTLSRHLGQSHSNIRRKANDVVANHPSAVCRAVCAFIISKHLAQFQQKILDIERSILTEDSSIVGPYNIVPLSTIVAAFDGWDRRLDWLWQFVSTIRIEESKDDTRASKAQSLYTASNVIRHLRDARHTGYPDIEQFALDLVEVAETAWLKQLTSWLLYGKLPSVGAPDFFVIQSIKEGDRQLYDLRPELVPPFVEPATANSILFIGKSIHHINARGASLGVESSLLNKSSASSLRSSYLKELETLRFPINASRFTGVIRSIRLSLSKNVLQQLLPLPSVLEILRILKDYFLLGHGEFALALISAADERLMEKQSTSLDKYRYKGSENLTHLIIKEGEVSAILSEAWSALASIQTLEDEEEGSDSETARKLIELSLESKIQPQKALLTGQGLPALPDSFQDLLVPTATVLTLRILSPLDLYLTPVDVMTYSRVHAYLLAIRRAHLHLSKLFTLSGLRRDPRRSPASSASERTQSLSRQTHRSSHRAKKIRPVWASISSMAFFLATIGAHFQSEVDQGWKGFREWLDPIISRMSRPSSRDYEPLDSAGKASTSSWHNPPFESASSFVLDSQDGKPLRDPERLMMAHQRYLASLRHALLLDRPSFTDRLRAFMTDIDHLCALLSRFDVVQQSMDLAGDTGTGRHSVNSGTEEPRLFDELDSARQRADVALHNLVSLLQDTGTARSTASSDYLMDGPTDGNEYIPRATNGLDRLLLKLDHINSQTKSLYLRDTDGLG
ncbi:MAG: hypothetical protein Q9201_000669 [Fulgogasparrea decipioides]